MCSEVAGDPDVRLAIAGDRDALERLLRDVGSEVQKALRVDSRWNRSLSADDILQVTYLEAFLRISSLQTPTRVAFVAWLKTMANNNLVDAVRGLERKKRPDQSDRVTQGVGGESARTLLLTVAGEQATAGGQAVVAEQIARLREAVAKLPTSYRIVVEQVELAERPIAAVAAEMSRSPGSVYMLRARALDRLRELLLVVGG